MKNMKRYASKKKISQKTVDAQRIEDLVSSFEKAFPGLLEWQQKKVAELEARK